MIIIRARCLRGVSSANFAQSPPLSSVWQSVQFMLVEAAKNPIVCMNSSTGIPFSSWTFLKTCSARSGFCSTPVWAGVWPLANKAPSRNKQIVAAAPSTVCLDPSLIFLHLVHTRSHS